MPHCRCLMITLPALVSEFVKYNLLMFYQTCLEWYLMTTYITAVLVFFIAVLYFHNFAGHCLTVTVTGEYVYLIAAVIGLIMKLCKLDIMTIILLRVYLPTWGSLATWLLCISTWGLEWWSLYQFLKLSYLVSRRYVIIFSSRK